MQAKLLETRCYHFLDQEQLYFGNRATHEDEACTDNPVNLKDTSIINVALMNSWGAHTKNSLSCNIQGSYGDYFKCSAAGS